MFHFNLNSKTALFPCKSVTKVLLSVSCMFGLNKQKGHCMRHFGVLVACLLPALPALSTVTLCCWPKGTACFVLLLVKTWNPKEIGEGHLIAIFCGTE